MTNTKQTITNGRQASELKTLALLYAEVPSPTVSSTYSLGAAGCEEGKLRIGLP